jgi:hypothetical protein
MTSTRTHEDEKNDLPITRLLHALFLAISGSETWERCWGLMHYMSISKLQWAERPTMEQAGAFLVSLQAEFPDHYVAILDSTEKDLQYRIMMQDAQAIAFFGPMSWEHGGTNRKLIHYTDYFRVCVAVVKAVSPIGRRDVVLPRLHLLTRDGSWKQFDVGSFPARNTRVWPNLGF